MSDSISNAPDAPHALAQWWSEQALGRIGFIGEGDGFTEMLSVVAGRQGVQVDDEKRERLKEALLERFQELLGSSQNRVSVGVSVGVDYGPDAILRDAAAEAGVDAGAFPWKTMTWMTKDYVTVSLGYAAPIKLVWMSPDWDRPKCASPKYNDDSFEREPWKCSEPLFHEGEHVYGDPQPLCQATEGFYIREAGGRCLRPADEVEHDLDHHYYGKFAHAFVE